MKRVTFLFLLLVGCGEVSTESGNGGASGAGPGGAGIAAGAAGAAGAGGAGGALEGRGGAPGPACVWPAGLDSSECRVVKECAGAPGFAICHLTKRVSSGGELYRTAVADPAPAGCWSGARRCIARCSDVGGLDATGGRAGVYADSDCEAP